MVLDANKLPDRDLKFLMNRLAWIDKEITRYRDFEWKATSFHAAFFVALLYAILNDKWQVHLCIHRTWLILAVICYLLISCRKNGVKSLFLTMDNFPSRKGSLCVPKASQQKVKDKDLTPQDFLCK